MQLPHSEPSEGQADVPQVPFVHCPVQHSPAVMQGAPLGLHIGRPHTPSKQVPVQQSSGSAQASPSGVHIGGPHTLSEQRPVQHSPAPPHI